MKRRQCGILALSCPPDDLAANPAMAKSAKNRKDALLVLLFVSAITIMTDAHEDQEGHCPRQCTCTSWDGDLFIDCSNQKLTSIPHLPHTVKYLHFNGNNLTQITTAEGLTQYPLVELHLNDNQISHINKNGLPRSLESISLANNLLTGVDKKMFRRRSNLLVLNLNNNKITNIDSGALPSALENIQLKNNRLEQVRRGMLSHLQQLRAIYLTKNKIERVEDRSFPPSVSIINLGNNRLNTIEYQFTNLPQLRVLNLYSNRIRHLQRKSFTKLPSLKELSLLDNELREIKAYQFSNLRDLTTLNLFSNSIGRFHQTALPPPGRLQRLYLQRNPLVCDCHLQWLPARLLDESLNARLFDLFFLDSSVPEEDWPFDYPDEDDIRCASPRSARSLRVTDMAVDFLCDATSTIQQVVRLTTTVAAAATEIIQIPLKEVSDMLTSPPTPQVKPLKITGLQLEERMKILERGSGIVLRNHHSSDPTPSSGMSLVPSLSITVFLLVNSAVFFLI